MCARQNRQLTTMELMWILLAGSMILVSVHATYYTGKLHWIGNDAWWFSALMLGFIDEG